MLFDNMELTKQQEVVIKYFKQLHVTYTEEEAAIYIANLIKNRNKK